MPIELRCSQCDTLLRVPDGSEGRETRCPACQTLLTIPGPVTAPQQSTDSGVDAVGRTPEQEANPFAAPTSEAQPGFGEGVSPFAGAPPAQLDIGELLTRTFAIYRQNIGACITMGVVVYYLPMVVMAALFGPMRAIMMSTGGVMAPQLQPDDVIRFAIVAAINMVLGIVLFAGAASFCLQMSRTGKGSIDNFVGGLRYALSLFVSNLMFSIAVGFGFVLCCAPGIWLAIVFSQFVWLIVDGRAGIVDCFSRSMEMTKGYRPILLVLLFILIGFSMVAGMIPFVALVLQPLAYPLIMVLGAVVYLTLSGQHVAGRLVTSPMPPTPMPPSAPPAGEDTPSDSAPDDSDDGMSETLPHGQ